MTTTKIDRETLSKLHMLADRDNRSATAQLKVIINHVWRANPTEISDADFFDDMFSQMISDSEDNAASEQALTNAESARKSGSISWGSENGRVVGTMVDGKRVDVDGNLLNPS